MEDKSDLKVHPILANFSQLSNDVKVRPIQAAQILGVSIATLWRLIRDNKLPVNRLTARTTTISVGDLRAFMAGKEV